MTSERHRKELFRAAPSNCQTYSGFTLERVFGYIQCIFILKASTWNFTPIFSRPHFPLYNQSTKWWQWVTRDLKRIFINLSKCIDNFYLSGGTWKKRKEINLENLTKLINFNIKEPFMKKTNINKVWWTFFFTFKTSRCLCICNADT